MASFRLDMLLMQLTIVIFSISSHSFLIKFKKISFEIFFLCTTILLTSFSIFFFKIAQTFSIQGYRKAKKEPDLKGEFSSHLEHHKKYVLSHYLAERPIGYHAL